MKARAYRPLLGVLALVWTATGDAAGPLLVSETGTPYAWRAHPVPFRHDRGRLGALTNAKARALVAAGFGVWEAVPTASIAFRDEGALPVDVRAGSYEAYVSGCTGTSAIIFDADGSITDDLLGVGARNVVLGFASPVCGDAAPATITRAVAVLNGRWVDGIASRRNPELPAAAFGAVFVHEFGHFLNLDHSQVNHVQAFDGDPGNDEVVPTMFPALVHGAEAATLSLDDVASVSALYPTPDFAVGTGRIEGQVVRGGEQPFQGAYVIARRVDAPLAMAIGYASGARAPRGASDAAKVLRGAYALAGLPPGTYTVEVEAIDPRFTGGSSVGPLDPPPPLPGGPEYWSGAAEGATAPPDDPSLASTVAVPAGALVAGIDIRLNEPSLPNDVCAGAIRIPPLPVRLTQDTAIATTSPDDPLQSCTVRGPATNAASVWFELTPAAPGRVVIATEGSSYDTVVSVYRGACGALEPIACNDDTPATVQSRLDLDVVAGAPLLLEVTAFGETPAGRLEISVRRGCSGLGPCDDEDPCSTGDVCFDGVCAGPLPTCDDGNPCTADACDDGICSSIRMDARCDDGDVCTVDDRCLDGTCTAGRFVDPATVAAGVDEALPASCGTLRPLSRRTIETRLERAAQRIRRSRSALRILAGLTRRMRRIASAHRPCATALAMRLDQAQRRLACVGAVTSP